MKRKKKNPDIILLEEQTSMTTIYLLYWGDSCSKFYDEIESVEYYSTFEKAKKAFDENIQLMIKDHQDSIDADKKEYERKLKEYQVDLEKTLEAQKKQPDLKLVYPYPPSEPQSYELYLPSFDEVFLGERLVE